MYGKREKRVTRGGARLSFCVTNGKREKKESLEASASTIKNENTKLKYLFTVIKESAAGAGLFCVTNGEREKRESLAASAGLSIPGICGQRTMISEGAKTKGPACTAGTA